MKRKNEFKSVHRSPIFICRATLAGALIFPLPFLYVISMTLKRQFIVSLDP